jgi:cytidylate kinase
LEVLKWGPENHILRPFFHFYVTSFLMTSAPFIIAIDGPSASGKGTIARKLAAELGFAHLDTGLLYRAVGMAVVRSGGDPGDPALAEKAASALNVAELNDPALRDDAAAVAASKVATIPAVRFALLKFQQDFCKNPPDGKPGAVLDGRDIGTVIAPDAEIKLYVTASAEARVERRFKELQAKALPDKGKNVTYDAVLKDMKERDARDASRSSAPLKPASDAVMLDTSAMTADEAFAEALRIVNLKLAIK